jgi:hypothetical protein
MEIWKRIQVTEHHPNDFKRDDKTLEAEINRQILASASEIVNINLVRYETKERKILKVLEKAQKEGLSLCPAVIGPCLRSQYTDQPKNEQLTIGMKHMSVTLDTNYDPVSAPDMKQFQFVFAVDHSPNLGLELFLHNANTLLHHTNNTFIFCLPDQ